MISILLDKQKVMSSLLTLIFISVSMYHIARYIIHYIICFTTLIRFKRNTRHGGVQAILKSDVLIVHK